MTWIDEVWERIAADAEALNGHGSFPIWSDGRQWHTLPFEERERGVLPHNGSWMVGDVAAILWFNASHRGTPDAGQALAMSRRLANRTGLTSFASVSHMFFRGALVPQSISGDAALVELADNAGRTVAQRFSRIGYMKSFGEAEDAKYPFVTIDDVINLVLPFWHARRTRDDGLAERLIDSARVIGRELIRPDGSAGQVLQMSPDGEPVGIDTYQGHSKDGCWSRGQAWGIYGYAMMYRATGVQEFRQFADAMTDYWIDRVQGDPSPVWDFEIAEGPGVIRDSFAASLAYAGLIDLADQSSDARRRELMQYARTMMQRLSEKYVLSVPAELGILSGAALDVPHAHGVDAYVIVGDSYFTEAIWRLTQETADGHSRPLLST